MSKHRAYQPLACRRLLEGLPVAFSCSIRMHISVTCLHVLRSHAPNFSPSPSSALASSSHLGCPAAGRRHLGQLPVQRHDGGGARRRVHAVREVPGQGETDTERADKGCPVGGGAQRVSNTSPRSSLKAVEPPPCSTRPNPCLLPPLPLSSSPPAPVIPLFLATPSLHT